jgi:hypothetical protein
VQVRFRRAPDASPAAAGAAGAAALQAPARSEAAEQTGMVTKETEPKEVDSEDENGRNLEKALERVTALAQEDEGDDPEELASTGWARGSSTRGRRA